MLAHHPETGQPIRILRSEAQITQSRRTLVWLRAEYSKSTRWSRWNAILTDPAAWQDGCGVVALVVQEWTTAWLPILQAATDNCLIIYKDGAVEKAMKRAGLPVDNFLSYKDLYNMYPFLGEPVHSTDPVEKVVVSVAHILRFPYLAWTAPPEINHVGVKAQITAWKTMCVGQIQVLPNAAVAEEVIPACWLIQQYFIHPNSKRAKELALCLEKNMANPYIDHILLLNERAMNDIPKSDKITERIIGHRMTYQDVLEAVRTEVPAGAFVVFANSDIWCDESLAVLWTIPLAERRMFLALLRWEDSEGEEPTLFGPRPDSQDTWILAKETVNFQPTEEEFGYPFGKPGCDNAIALALLKRHCLVVNPAYSIKTHHVHTSNIRDYNPRDILYKPMYLYMDPTPIQMFAVEEHMKSWESKGLTGVWRREQPIVTVNRRMYYVNETAAKTVCRAIADREGEKFQHDGVNLWTPTSNTRPLYDLKNAFASDTGLLSNFNAIFVGNHETWRDGWRDSTLSSVSTTIHVPSLLSIHVPADCWKSLASWCIHYLPTVLRLRKIAGSQYEFLVPTLPDVPAFLYDCKWHEDHVGTVPHITNTLYFSQSILAPAPVSPTTNKITKEDVSLLRGLLPPARERGHTIVICLDEDNGIFTEGWLDEWRTCHAILLRGMHITIVRPSDSPRSRREAFQSADWVFGRRAALQWLWMAKPGTRIVEWMLETEISSEILHLAGAADCKYILSLVRKEPVEFQRQNAILEFSKIWAEFAFSETVAATVKDKPTLIVPAGNALNGIWSREEDPSFMEIVRLWGERGYCQLMESEESPYVWWGSIGETLLYDWNTPRWWDSATNYQMALFGASELPGPEGHETRQSIWSFWGKSPHLLELAVGEGRLKWNERPIQSIYTGKIANGLHKTRKCAANWGSVIELYNVITDSTGGPYPYTDTEYIAKLRKTRFGLCLQGSGTNCHREIEYMALGVVPVLTPGVNFTHYLVPPREGEHFLRVTTPQDFQQILQTVTAEKWEAMSNACQTWWRQNASVEGLFRLTWGRIEQCKPFKGVVMPLWNP